VKHFRPEAADAQKSPLVKTHQQNWAEAGDCSLISGYGGNWSPSDLCSTASLLKAHRAIGEAHIAKNLAAAAIVLPYEPGWSFPEVRARGVPKLYPYHLAFDQFETPDDRQEPRRKIFGDIRLAIAEIEDSGALKVLSERIDPPQPIKAQSYLDSTEGPGRVRALALDYEASEPESFAPRGEFLAPMDATGGWGKYDPLGFDAKADLVGKMDAAVKAWAGMTTPPPRAADVTVAVLVEDYLASGGKVQTRAAYRTTPVSKVRVKPGSTWTAISGIPRELRATKKRFGVRPKSGSKAWSNVSA
jgi:hypothetical protein